MLNMRYHTFKSSTMEKFLFSDPQAKNLLSPNFNFFIKSWGRTKDVWLFLQSPGEYELIVLFIGGNHLFELQAPSIVSPERATDQFIELAQHLKELSSKVFFIGISPRFNLPERSVAVNGLLAENSLSTTSWELRGISSLNYICDIHTKSDGVQLTENAFSGIEPILNKR